MEIDLPKGTKVRTPEGYVGRVIQAKNTIWAFERRVFSDPTDLTQKLDLGWWPTHKLEEVE